MKTFKDQLKTNINETCLFGYNGFQVFKYFSGVGSIIIIDGFLHNDKLLNILITLVKIYLK